MSIKISILQVMCGDGIIVQYGPLGNEKYIIIDGGYIGDTYTTSLQPQLSAIAQANATIKLWILTHLDADHINGMVSFLRDKRLEKSIVEQVWFNCFDKFILPKEGELISVTKGVEIRDKLKKLKSTLHTHILQGLNWKDDEVDIAVLSPTKETYDRLSCIWEKEERQYWEKKTTRLVIGKSNDYKHPIDELVRLPDLIEERNDIVNKSSISFILKAGDKKILFLGDAHISDVVNALKKKYPTQESIHFDAVKLSHHGSKHNFRSELLDLIICDTYIISSNGKNISCLPDKQVLAKILCHPKRDISKRIHFIFNYDNDVIRSIFSVDKNAIEVYNFKCIYPNAKDRFVALLF
jgi:beta-lactamase superfamily II metal-dependent hydrolase